jgi:hypothetical protein
MIVLLMACEQGVCCMWGSNITVKVAPYVGAMGWKVPLCCLKLAALSARDSIVCSQTEVLHLLLAGNFCFCCAGMSAVQGVAHHELRSSMFRAQIFQLAPIEL